MSRTAKPAGGFLGLILAGLLCAAAGGAAVWGRVEARKSEEDLQRAKDDYASMSKWKRPVEEMLRSNTTLKGMETTEDLLTFIDRKARQAQIPAGMFTIAKNQDQTTGSWKESSYTVTLRPSSKEVPVSRDALVDLLRLIETERRSVKAKNLQVTYAGQNLSSATLTFAQYAPK